MYGYVTVTSTWELACRVRSDREFAGKWLSPLYTHCHLAERGVLVVGPSAVFLGYISQVLPGLGETNVLLRTVGELFPGVTADRAEGRLTDEVKGRAMMGGVLAASVKDRQSVGPAVIEFAGETLRLDHQVVAEATRQARATRLPHNRAGQSFRGRSSPRSPSGTPESPANSPGSLRPT
jgi:DNA helicase IV